MAKVVLTPTREQLIHSLYEAAEVEHNLMCTYLYAAFSMKDGEAKGLSKDEVEAVTRWKRTILAVAVEEMGHLAAVWNITAAVGGVPRFGRTNFPLSPGYLPAGIVVKLAPFNEDVLQHFVHLERPKASAEPDGKGFDPPPAFLRAPTSPKLTPMPIDYETVGEFYEVLEAGLRVMADKLGEKALFCGDPALQLSPNETYLSGAKPVLCLKTALQACEAIVTQGEGASAEHPDSHFCRFVAIRKEYEVLKSKNPDFTPSHPAAHNPVLRRPPTPQGHVWIDDPMASAVVDVANACYQLMLRLISYTYEVASPHPEKNLAVDLGIDLMKAMTMLGESAAQRPAGKDHPECNAGVSFTALRDSAPFPRGSRARRFFAERMHELAKGAERLDQADQRCARAAGLLKALAARAQRFETMSDAPNIVVAPTAAAPAPTPAVSTVANGVEQIKGEKLDINYRGKLCIHSRFCVTQAPRVFLANVEGPWIHPDDMDAEELAAISRNCPSGAIQYVRKDGAPAEQAPLVNLIRTQQDGPNAFRGDLRIDGAPIGYRATLCRCGASKNKPFCDGSHHEIHFEATGEPITGENTAMLAARDGPIEITPQTDGPLMVRGNMEIISGAGRMVARTTAARLCRCGHSANKPYCDGTHVKVGFKST